MEYKKLSEVFSKTCIDFTNKGKTKLVRHAFGKDRKAEKKAYHVILRFINVLINQKNIMTANIF